MSGQFDYGEIMFVMECILDNLRSGSERDSQANVKIKGLMRLLTFTTLFNDFFPLNRNW